MFLQVCVCPRGGGVCLSACWDTPQEQTPPRSRHPQGADTPTADTPGSGHPPEWTPPGAATPQEQTPPQSRPPGADTPRSRHPQGADTPQSRHPPEGRPLVPSYWNAFLLEYKFCPSKSRFKHGFCTTGNLKRKIMWKISLWQYFKISSFVAQNQHLDLDFGDKNDSLLAIVDIAAVQSSAHTFIHNAILLIDTIFVDNC